MFELTWQEFSTRPHIAKLALHEQIKQFHWEQQRHQLMLEYISSTTPPAADGSNTTAV